MSKTAALLMTLFSVVASAQEEQIVFRKKNVVKILLTPNLFYDNAVVLGYERVLKNNHQSLNFSGGVVEFPKVFSSLDLVRVDRETKRTGFLLAFDYRFYLQKENKFTAPRGIYLAPFISYYNFRKDWDLTSVSSGSSATVHGNVAFLNIGGQIGYQFIVKDRFTFDFIFFGPSITNYKLGLDMEGDLTPDEENEWIGAVLDRFPLLDDLIEDNSVSMNGVNSTWALGYRFTTIIGYTFGRKK